MWHGREGLMTVRSLNRLKALILILMALFFMEKYITGRLYYFIGPRFGWLAIVAVGLFILLAGAYNLTEKGNTPEFGYGHTHSKQSIWHLLIVALPLILGVLIPSEPLGASAV